MITLHILQLLEDNGLGKVAIDGFTTDPDLYFEKLPQGVNGVYIVARGAAQSRGTRTSQAFDLYARGANDLDGAVRLEAIADFFDSTYGTTCELPTVTGLSNKQYKSVAITPTSSISNVGVDDDDRVIYVLSALVTYSK